MTKRGVLLNIRWDVEGKVEAFQRLLPDHKLINFKDGDSHELDNIQYAVVWKPDHGLLAKLPDLEVIFSLGAGVDHIFEDPAVPDLPLVRFVDGDLTGRMVEWIVLQTLMHLRQQREYDRLQQDRHWKELHQPAAHSVRVGIMGLGELGIASAKSLMSLGFQLNSWSRSEKSIAGITSYFGDNQLHAFLGNTDILISLLPYTQSTHGILNRQLFEKLARNGALNAPVVINAGRGGSQVETDIVTCLQDGTLGGVSLDVFETEPLAPSSPLWVFENAILTPHVAAISDPNALAQYVAGQILSYEDGKPLDNLVDKKRGY